MFYVHLPDEQDAVTVVGYPLGGDTISVTKGVVSRIEVCFFLLEHNHMKLIYKTPLLFLEHCY